MTTMDVRPEAAKSSSDKPKAPKWGAVARGGSYWSWLMAIAPVAALAIGWRTYQQVFAFEYGLDAHNANFDKYWLSLALTNMTVLPALAGVWYVWMWVSGQKLPKQISREDEGRRIWNLWLIILSFTVAVFVGGSYCAEQDASWHQIVTRDSAFTPSHDVLFYGSFPLMIYLATGSYIYARTRLPHLYGGKLMAVSFALIIGGSVLLLFQVAMNEFGHSFFQAEEPFVLFAYLLAGTFAVWFATVPRLVELARQEQRIAQTPDTAAAVGDVTRV